MRIFTLKSWSKFIDFENRNNSEEVLSLDQLAPKLGKRKKKPSSFASETEEK